MIRVRGGGVGWVIDTLLHWWIVYFVLTRQQRVGCSSEAPAGPGSERLAVVVDVGSTGTRPHLFRWTYSSRACRDTGAVHLILPDQHVKVRPGLTTFLDAQLRLRSSEQAARGGCRIAQPDDARPCAGLANGIAQYFGLVKTHIDAAVPAPLRRSTPVFLLGTAGIRSLLPAEQRVLLNVVGQHLRNAWADYLVRPEWIRVIDGYREGLYSWIVLNQLLRRPVGSYYDNMIFSSFSPERPFLKTNRTTSPGSPMLIELGGASAQIVVEPSGSGWSDVSAHSTLPHRWSTANSTAGTSERQDRGDAPSRGPVAAIEDMDGFINLRFCGVETVVYSRSFEGFGRQLAFQRFLQSNAQPPGVPETPHRIACVTPDVFFPKFRSDSNVVVEDIGTPLSDVTSNSSTGLPSGFTGLSNPTFDECQRAVRRALFTHQDKCRFNHEPFTLTARVCPSKWTSPSLSFPLPFFTRNITEVVGNENLYFFHQLVAGPKSAERTTHFSVEWFRQRARHLCELTSVDAVTAAIDPKAEPEKARTGCFGLTYMAEFLERLLETTDRYEFHALRSVNGMEIGWPAGFLLVELPWMVRALPHVFLPPTANQGAGAASAAPSSRAD